MLRSILIGLDSSACYDAVVELGIRWAQRFDAVLVGLGIVDEPAVHKHEPVPTGGLHYTMERDRCLLTDARRRVAGSVDHFVLRCALAGVKCRAIQVVGPPETQILQQSRLCDLIVLGQQPRFDFEMPYWPDQTLPEVLRQNSRPVVVVPEFPQGWGCAMVAYDGSPQADRALQAFRALGLAGEDEVYILSVQTDQSDAQRLAEQAVDFLRLHGVKAVPLPIRSKMSVDRTILAKVQEVQPHLLVMGAHGRPTWREFVFGSITTRVLEASPVPLFLCR